MTEDRNIDLGETSESRLQFPEPAVDGTSAGSADQGLPAASDGFPGDEAVANVGEDANGEAGLLTGSRSTEGHEVTGHRAAATDSPVDPPVAAQSDSTAAAAAALGAPPDYTILAAQAVEDRTPAGDHPQADESATAESAATDRDPGSPVAPDATTPPEQPTSTDGCAPDAGAPSATDDRPTAEWTDTNDASVPADQRAPIADHGTGTVDSDSSADVPSATPAQLSADPSLNAEPIADTESATADRPIAEPVGAVHDETGHAPEGEHDLPAGPAPSEPTATADSAVPGEPADASSAAVTDLVAAAEASQDGTATENPSQAEPATTPDTSPETSAAETSAPDTSAPETSAPDTSGSKGSSSGRPAPGRGPRPGAPGNRHPVTRPSPAAAASHTATKEPSFEPVDPHQWGRIDENGVVYVYSASTGERPVGNWQAGDVDAGLAHFGRRFDDFVTEIALLETRLASGSGDPKATKQHAIELRESVDSLAAVGDFDSAAIRLEVVIGAADVAIAGASKARAAARSRAIAAKEALCAEAEALAESTAWKTTGDRLKAIVDEWRTIHGIDRKTDDALWKRFAKARDAFTRHRGTHFADLDKQRASAREAKEKLIARAEELSDSSEWGRTAGDYRQLMEQWKASGRAPRDIEDELWNRFRAAQEKFFARRNQTFSQRDAEFEANAAAKEKLLAEAEKIDPVKNLDAARAALRSVQERWESAGKVPRERIREFEGRLHAVEDRIKRAEDSHWRRTDPETVARIEQFRSRAESFRQQSAKARAAGDERKALQAEAQARQWEEWLAAAQGAAT